jgi:hypothetical protein
MMRLTAALIFFAMGCSTATGALADEMFPPCPAKLEPWFADRAFRPYLVSVPRYRPVRPDLRFGRAHLYRSIIATDSRGGANFAGHYTISSAGCGTRTSCIAIVDQRTGKVHFPPEMLTASRVFVDIAPRDYDALYFRKTSDLLVLIGSANEDTDHEGVSYYRWKNDTLRLIRHIPIARLCGWPNGKRP